MKEFNTGVLFGELEEEEKEKIDCWINSTNNDSLFLCSLFDSWLKLIEKMKDFNISKDQYIRKKYLNLESKQDLVERIEQTLKLKELNENDVKKVLSLESSIFSILNEQVFQAYFNQEINLSDKNLYRQSKRDEKTCKHKKFWREKKNISQLFISVGQDVQISTV